jgi:hypothetical protein
MKRMTNEDVVKKASEKLMMEYENPKLDWHVAYQRYKQKLKANKDLFINASAVLKKYLGKTKMGPIRIYSSISMAQQSPIAFDLRVFGQSVATLKVKKDKLFLIIEEGNKKHPTHNKEYFGIETPAGCYSWDSDIAQSMFSMFSNINSASTHSKEHKLETLVLSDLAKEHKKDGKKLTYIRPVILSGKGFFQMKTPFSASDHNVKDYPVYSMRDNGAANGGGIDILARVAHNDGSWRLAVIELKDENKKGESQPIVMQQALAYATFVAHLLRDRNCGDFWWNIFRNQDDEKALDENKELKIDVVTMMPPIPVDKNQKPIYNEGDMQPIIVPGVPNVTLYPSTIYIDADLEDSRINKVYGTLIDEKKQ